jgi:hypothetical protein
MPLGYYVHKFLRSCTDHQDKCVWLPGPKYMRGRPSLKKWLSVVCRFRTVELNKCSFLRNFCFRINSLQKTKNVYFAWSQSYDRDLQRRRCNFYNATGSLARFENKNILFYFEKRSSLLQRRHCSCKFKNRSIGSWLHGQVVSSVTDTKEIGAYGSWDRILPGYKAVAFKKSMKKMIILP